METLWTQKWNFIKSLKSKEELESPVLMQKGNFHYTSIKVLFSILSGNEFWASNVRFSNDSMEERFFNPDKVSRRDDFIICFCKENDKLSQWRGYCHSGGASIELYMHEPMQFSVLHKDFDTTGRYELYENYAFPVVYLDPTANAEVKWNDIKNNIKNKKYGDNISVEDIIPFLKNGYFYEEEESRLVFSNIQGSLSKCIRFRALSDGVQVPYIVVKFGDLGKMKGTCFTDEAHYPDKYILNNIVEETPIWIDEGYDQEAKYFQMLERVNRIKEENGISSPTQILCKGKLPIMRITLAPTYDRERKAEQIKRFCMSKYWLSNVVVDISKIPYVQPLL